MAFPFEASTGSGTIWSSRRQLLNYPGPNAGSRAHVSQYGTCNDPRGVSSIEDSDEGEGVVGLETPAL